MNMIPVAKPCLGQEELKAIGEVFDSNWLGLGAKTKEFEDAIGKYIGCKHVIAVNTGTNAIHLALDALGIKTGDEVIVPSLTFAATIQAILQTGALPVFCDIRSDNLNIDVQKAKTLITERTKALLVVHYCGEPCDMDELLALNIPVVEDAAHAFGSTYKGKKIGSFGHLTCFSFDPIKTITSIEGGAITTNDEKLFELMTRKRILGIDKDTWSRYQNKRAWDYDVTTHGFRYHMPNVNAAVGLIQLAKIEGFIKNRRATVKEYDLNFIKNKNIELLKKDQVNSAFFCYIIKVKNDNRSALMEHLKKNNVGSGIHYIPNHHHSHFKDFPSGDLSTTEKVEHEILTLPLYNMMTAEEVAKVIEAINSF
ncbi:DegT/DnrJ/EryC1/StrS family aminotransferase [Candidatus Margulisiibacteriota bacterium]